MLNEIPSTPEVRRLDVPLGELPAEGYIGRHVELRLNVPQSHTLKRLVAGLQSINARTSDGKAVDGTAGGIRWLLDAVHSSPPAKSNADPKKGRPPRGKGNPDPD